MTGKIKQILSNKFSNKSRNLKFFKCRIFIPTFVKTGKNHNECLTRLARTSSSQAVGNSLPGNLAIQAWQKSEKTPLWDDIVVAVVSV